MTKQFVFFFIILTCAFHFSIAFAIPTYFLFQPMHRLFSCSYLILSRHLTASLFNLTIIIKYVHIAHLKVPAQRQK